MRARATPRAVRRDHEVGAGARGLLALQRVEDRRGVGLAGLGHERRHHRDRAGVVDDDGERAVELVVAVLLERLPARAGLLQVLVDLGVGDLARAVGRDGDGAAHGDQDQKRHREEDLERQRESGRLGRRKLQPLRPDLARGRAGAGVDECALVTLILVGRRRLVVLAVLVLVRLRLERRKVDADRGARGRRPRRPSR